MHHIVVTKGSSWQPYVSWLTVGSKLNKTCIFRAIELIRIHQICFETCMFGYTFNASEQKLAWTFELSHIDQEIKCNSLNMMKRIHIQKESISLLSKDILRIIEIGIIHWKKQRNQRTRMQSRQTLWWNKIHKFLNRLVHVTNVPCYPTSALWTVESGRGWSAKWGVWKEWFVEWGM